MMDTGTVPCSNTNGSSKVPTPLSAKGESPFADTAAVNPTSGAASPGTASIIIDKVSGLDTVVSASAVNTDNVSLYSPDINRVTDGMRTTAALSPTPRRAKFSHNRVVRLSPSSHPRS